MKERSEAHFFLCYLYHQQAIQRGFTQIKGVDETSVDEIGVDETVVDETGIDEPGINPRNQPSRSTVHMRTGAQ